MERIISYMTKQELLEILNLKEFDAEIRIEDLDGTEYKIKETYWDGDIYSLTIRLDHEPEDC